MQADIRNWRGCDDIFRAFVKGRNQLNCNTFVPKGDAACGCDGTPPQLLCKTLPGSFSGSMARNLRSLVSFGFAGVTKRGTKDSCIPKTAQNL